jgi:DNA uptake protein ComE-like DNA-binding protein
MKKIATLVFTALVLALSVPTVGAQVGKGIVDLNTVPEAALTALPNMNPTLAKDIIAARPFGSIVEFNTFVLGKGVTQPQLAELYAKAFIHVNLNTGTREEILLIPGAGNRMVREFAEYRPWVNWVQFDKEISKYVGQPDTDRLKQYVFIPVKLNTATDEDILSIPGAGQKMVREFKEYRPWTAQAQFDKEISKYVGAKETARLWRYVVIDK